MVSIFSALFPPSPIFTEKDLADQAGKVFIVTGAASGIGLELAKILYSKNGSVYVGARSATRVEGAIKKIQTALPASKGRLVPLIVDLADFDTIKPAAAQFLKQESRLDVLVHNAGLMEPPLGSKTRTGQDLEIGTHCLGPFILTTLLQDIMKQTAAKTPSEPYRVRIVWLSSLLSLNATPGGMVFDDEGVPKAIPKVFPNYTQSKVGSAWLASGFADRLDHNKILSVAVHPGVMRTELQRTVSLHLRILMSLTFIKPAIYGAYSELYCALSSDLNAEKIKGRYVIPWGRIEPLPKDIAQEQGTQEDGRVGKAATFWTYCERETKKYL